MRNIKESKLLKIVGIPFLAMALGINIGCAAIKTTPNMYGQISNVPVYEYKENNCAAYATRVSREVYGKKMIYADAWNMIYKNKKIAKIKNDEHLKQLIEKRILKPGMIIGVYYPFSSYLNGTDKKGKKRRYTHLVVFAGTNQEGEPTFYHQFKDKIEKITLKRLKNKVSKLVEIIDEK